MASIRAAQASVAVAYARLWPVVRSVQTTVALLYDPSPPPGGGGASTSMLCQIIG